MGIDPFANMLDGESPPTEGVVYCIPLVERKRRLFGLVLVPTLERGTYQRIGAFEAEEKEAGEAPVWLKQRDPLPYERYLRAENGRFAIEIV